MAGHRAKIPVNTLMNRQSLIEGSILRDRRLFAADEQHGSYPRLVFPVGLVHVTTAVTVPIPLTTFVTFDVSGTYPANSTKSQLTTSNASFLIEFTVKQVVPATPLNIPFYFQTPLSHASYSFEGVTYSATASSLFTRSDSGGNLESIALTFETGTFVLVSAPIQHTPDLSTRLGSNAEFLVGNLGPGTDWTVIYAPNANGARSFYNPVSVNEVVSRLLIRPEPCPIP